MRKTLFLMSAIFVGLLVVVACEKECEKPLTGEEYCKLTGMGEPMPNGCWMVERAGCEHTQCDCDPTVPMAGPGNAPETFATPY